MCKSEAGSNPARLLSRFLSPPPFLFCFLLLQIAMLGFLTTGARATQQAASRLLQSPFAASFVAPSAGAFASVCSKLLSSRSGDAMSRSAPADSSCKSADVNTCQSGGVHSPVEHPAFDLLQSQYVAEYDLHVVDYKHRQSSARVISLTAPKTETEKAFMVAFRTPIENSAGAPHIVEHSVLMGSEKYPVKEPFVALMKSSLYTYMNALTYPDRTCYPIASVNLKDFYNLASVYMDAVFRPKALEDHLTLRQEGWRYELTPKGMTPSDAGADVQTQVEEYAKQAAQCIENPFACDFKIQGVVLNEMKGVYSSPDSLHSRLKQRALFPNLPHYNLDSGGDPKAIPNLTYEEFKQFYNKRYFPGNARIYFWGADDVKRRLDFVDDYLSKLPLREGGDTTIGTQRHLTEPRFVEEAYPASANKLEDYVSVNWVLDAVREDGDSAPQLEAADRMALQLLSHLLVSTTASPLYKALTESGLGKSMIGGGLGLDLRHATFSAGLKGLPQDGDMAAAVESVIFKCLKTLANEGFSQDAIDAALNTMEFTLRELNTGTFPKGLAIILDMATESNYDRDPVASLAFEKALDAVKERLKAGEPLFQNLIKRYLLNNTHRVTIKLRADPTMQEREAAQEAEKLKKIQEALTPDVVESILTDQISLKQRQVRQR
ncbi:mitochondrial presequence protease related protein [Cyclospora cayetanensis]|uniref:Mitochondrial presequence protease related protein n=1 Tax=Cyclospora cayetanensis TaxID=88456 RepID=A0A1D3D5Y5_9EIME|nr:mitochondrial presequence protease related protein [Cyclospora cayetanensis]